MKFIKQAIKVTPETHEAVQRKLLKQGYKWINGKEEVIPLGDDYIITNEKNYIYWSHKLGSDALAFGQGAKRMAAEEFLKDVMEPFYIYTPTPKISQEVQKRLFELGYEWCHGSKNEILEESYCLHLLKVDGKVVSQSHTNYSNSKEVSLKELFSDNFPPYAEPGRHIPKGELLPDYEVVITKDFLEIPEISVKIPMEEIRNLAAAIAAPLPKLKKIYIHAPGPELMKFVYEKLVSMGYEGYAKPSYICLDSYGKICWDDGKQYFISIGYKEMTIPELFSLSPPLPDLAGYKVSLTKNTLKVGCQEIPLAKFNQLQGEQAGR